MATSIVTRKPMFPRSIAKTLISHGTPPHLVAERCEFDLDRIEEYYPNVKPAKSNTVLREVPYNGGCSTESGTVPVTMPRVSIINGPANDNVFLRVSA